MKRFFSCRFLFRAFGLGWVIAGGVIFAAGAEQPAVMPETSVSLRGVAGGSIEIGEPLRVAVRVNLPGETSAKITLAPAKGTWMDAISVEILSADGNRVLATAQVVVGTAEASVVLDQEAAANGLWWIPSDKMGALAAGNYLVRAKLVIRDGAGWKGESVSEPAELSVVAPSNEPQRVTQRILARAHAAVLEDAPAKAAEMLDEVLKRNPDDIPILEMRAALCLHGGNPASAYVCINRARTLAARLGGHPSGQLHAFAARIEAAMAETAAAPTPEAWSSAPLSVFAPIRPPAAASEPKTAATVPAPSAQKQASVSAPAPAPAPTAATAASNVSAVVPAAKPGPGVVVPSAELSDQKIIDDLYGRWASGATAGSQYGRAQYSAAQATGAPNISVAGNSPQAWCPAVRDKGMDWLEVTFAEPLEASELRVRQNDASGAIVKIEAFDTDGTAHLWWEGVDPHKAAGVREIVWFAVRVPKTEYTVARVKITLNLASGPGYKQIDAVQLVAAP